MSLIKKSFRFSLGTMFSRIVGLLRESVLAGVFGASQFMDIFLVANRIPNMLRDIAAEGALGASFTKVFSQTWKSDKKKAQQLFLDATVVFGLICSLIVLLGLLFAPQIVKFMSLYQNEARGESFLLHTSNLTRLLFPFLLLMSLNSIFAGALHQKNKFFLSAISPVMLNLGYILGALFISQLCMFFLPVWVDKSFAHRNLIGLCIGVLLGGFLQMSLSFYGVTSSDNFSFRGLRLFKAFSTEVKEVLLLSFPMIFAASSTQINVIVNTNFATSLGVGAVSWLSYSFRLLQLPIGVFCVGIGYVILPVLSQLDRSNKTIYLQSMRKELQKTFELSLWLLVPCGYFLYFDALHIIELIFFHGSFSLHDVANTTKSLQLYSLGLLGYGFIKVLISFYYALERTKYAMYISLIAVLVNFVLTLLLVKYLGFEGIALSRRHKSGIATRFPRILRWREDKKIEEANSKTLLNFKPDQISHLQRCGAEPRSTLFFFNCMPNLSNSSTDLMTPCCLR